MLYNNTPDRYPIRKKMPVAKFYYKGNSHSHPVRRTILVIESTSTYIKGYELREGSKVRSFHKAPIKTFSKNRIAKIKQCGFRLRGRVPKKHHGDSTLGTMNLVDLVKHGA